MKHCKATLLVISILFCMSLAALSSASSTVTITEAGIGIDYDTGYWTPWDVGVSWTWGGPIYMTPDHVSVHYQVTAEVQFAADANGQTQFAAPTTSWQVTDIHTNLAVNGTDSLSGNKNGGGTGVTIANAAYNNHGFATYFRWRFKYSIYVEWFSSGGSRLDTASTNDYSDWCPWTLIPSSPPQ